MRIALILLMITLPAAAQWNLQESHTTASLRGIHSLGNGVAWASGSGGTILRTADGGSNWIKCTVPEGAEKLDFRGVQASDAKSAIVMSSGTGDLSRLYKTDDGCKTWTLLLKNSDKDGFWDALVLEQGRKSAWILGDPVAGQFVVLRLSLTGKQPAEPNRCNDSGSSASADLLVRDCADGLKADPAGAGAFAASNSSFFVMRNAFQSYFGPPPIPGEKVNLTWVDRQFFVTGGKAGARWCERIGFRGGDMIEPLQWSCESLPLGGSTEGSGAFSLYFNDAHVGMAVGGDYTHPNETTNTAAFRPAEGKTWPKWAAAATPPHGYRSAVAYDETRKTWITVGPNGTDVSTDDGQNWHPLTPGPVDAPDADRNWNALSLPFVVGSKGRIGVLRAGALGKP